MVYILCKINELCNFEIYSTYTFAYCQVYFTLCQVSAQWHIVQRASLCSVGLYWLRETDMLISINKKKMSAFLEQQPFLTTHLFVCTTRQIGKVIFVSHETRHGGTFIKSCKLFPWPKKKDITYWLQEFWWSRNCIQFERRPMQWSDCCGQIKHSDSQMLNQYYIRESSIYLDGVPTSPYITWLEPKSLQSLDNLVICPNWELSSVGIMGYVD